MGEKIMQLLPPTAEYRRSFLNEYNEKNQSAETGLLGRSILSRDIDYFKIGRGKGNIVLVGAHHGMEYITALALYDLIEFLNEKSTRHASYCGIDIDFLLQKFTFWIVPCLNPDGVELCLTGVREGPLRQRQIKMNGSEDFSHWQANARGVDLNHNYNYRFAEYKEYEARRGITAGAGGFSGEYPESEPETRALANLIRTLAPSLTLSLHTQGEELYSMPKNSHMERLSAKIASAIGYTYAQPEGGSACGGLTDYVGGVLGIPAFTVELGRGKNPLPLSNLSEMLPTVRRLAVLLPTYL